MGVYSGRRVKTGDESRVEPNASGEIIAFLFVERGEVVAEKYRARQTLLAAAEGAQNFLQFRCARRSLTAG
jgi:hypothetical protein